ncbi:peptidylprolyl isomerase [Rhodobacteraceae bacterium RKSG542]|nr:peptidylprolyl isomerase [Pseudovibrio flavus]
MKTSQLGLLFAAALLVAPLTAPLPTQAATRIEIVINDKPITSYDLSQRVKLIQLTTPYKGSAAKKRAKEELIDEALKLQEAKRIGVRINDKQVDDAFATIAKRVKLSPSQFKQALGQNGVNSKTLKDRLRAEIAWSDVVMQRFRATVRINESDVIAAMQGSGKADSDNSAVEYDLQRVIFVIPENASSSFKRKRQNEVDKLRSRFTSCKDGLRIASGLKEVVVKPIGKRLETDLPPQLREQLSKISVGRLLPPEKEKNSISMLAVCGKRTIQSDAAAREEIEGELRNKQGQQLSRRYLHDLRANAVIEER